jgi:hypothetical protein
MNPGFFHLGNVPNKGASHKLEGNYYNNGSYQKGIFQSSQLNRSTGGQGSHNHQIIAGFKNPGNTFYICCSPAYYFAFFQFHEGFPFHIPYLTKLLGGQDQKGYGYVIRFGYSRNRHRSQTGRNKA